MPKTRGTLCAQVVKKTKQKMPASLALSKQVICSSSSSSKEVATDLKGLEADVAGGHAEMTGKARGRG